MEDKLLRYTMRIDRKLFQKFRYIAEWNGRSANRQLEQFIKKCVADFESKNGPIELEDEE